MCRKEASTNSMAWHGTVPRTMHLPDMPLVLLHATGRVTCSVDSPSTYLYCTVKCLSHHNVEISMG